MRVTIEFTNAEPKVYEDIHWLSVAHPLNEEGYDGTIYSDCHRKHQGVTRHVGDVCVTADQYNDRHSAGDCE